MGNCCPAAGSGADGVVVA